MLSLYDEGVILDGDWSWPINIAAMLDNDMIQFWLVWCAKNDGDSKCNCYPTTPVGVAETKEKAVQAWEFQHFVDGKR